MSQFYRAYLTTSTGSPGIAQSTVLPAFATGLPGQVLALNATASDLVWVNAGTGGSSALFPSTTATGQLLVSTGVGASNTNTKWLNRGTSGQYLRVNTAGTDLEWTTLAASGGGTTTDTDSRMPVSPAANRVLVTTGIGDVHSSANSIGSTAGNNSTWLATGDVGQSLTVDVSGTLAWIPKQNKFPNTLGNTRDQLLIVRDNGVAGDVASRGVWLPATSTKQYLVSSPTGIISWEVLTTPNSKIPNTTANQQILISTAIGDPATTASGGNSASTWLNKGGNGEYLRVNASGLLEWGIPSVSGSTGENSKLPPAGGSGQIFIATGVGDVHSTASGGGGNGVWLPRGGADQLLTVSSDGTNVFWRTFQGVDTNGKLPVVPSNTNSFLLVGSGAGDPDTIESGGQGRSSWLSTGTDGQVLTTVATGTAQGNSVQWQSPSSSAPPAGLLPKALVYYRLSNIQTANNNAELTIFWNNRLEGDAYHSGGNITLPFTGTYFIAMRTSITLGGSFSSAGGLMEAGIKLYQNNTNIGDLLSTSINERSGNRTVQTSGFRMFGATAGDVIRLALNSRFFNMSGGVRDCFIQGNLNSDQLFLWRLT